LQGILQKAWGKFKQKKTQELYLKIIFIYEKSVKMTMEN